MRPAILLMLVIISWYCLLPSQTWLIIIACITERYHLAWSFSIPGQNVIVSLLCIAFTTPVMRRWFRDEEYSIFCCHHVFVLAPSFLVSSTRVHTKICRWNHSRASSSANNLSLSCTSLLFFNRVFFCEMMDSTFSISSTDLMASIWSWKVLFTSGLFSWLICSFRKDILSSIICCRLVDII